MDTTPLIHVLLDKAYSRDKVCENELFEKINARISHLMRYKMWGPRRQDGLTEDALEVRQLIMTELYDLFLKKQLPKKDLLKFIYTIMNRRIVDYLRKKYTKKKYFDDIDIPYSLMDEELLEKCYENKELHHIMSRAFDRLLNKCKEIIQALLNDTKKKYIEKLSKKQTKNSIYTDIHRCRKRFVKLLKEEGYGS